MKLLSCVAVLLLSTAASAQNIQSYFNKFDLKPEGISLDSANEHFRVTVDEKNAYIFISYDDPDYGYEYGGEISFTYFIKADKQKVFAYSTFAEGPSSISTQTNFYTYTGGKWNNITGVVLPDISLQDFTTDVLADSVGADYNIQLELPQHGTSVMVKVHPVGENNAPFDYARYLSFIQSLPVRTLAWKKEKGVFEFLPQ